MVSNGSSNDVPCCLRIGIEEGKKMSDNLDKPLAKQGNICSENGVINTMV